MASATRLRSRRRSFDPFDPDQVRAYRNAGYVPLLNLPGFDVRNAPSTAGPSMDFAIDEHGSTGRVERERWSAR